MIIFYRLVFIPILLVSLPYYLFRMWKRGGYSNGFLNRFGFMGKVPRKNSQVKRIWIQAVSVGEILAVKPLIEKLIYSEEVEIALSTTTSTGLIIAQSKLEESTIWQGVFPVDWFPFSSRAWNELQPDLAIVMESELWPEHLHQAKKRGVPVYLINARLSDKSYARHLKLQKITSTLLKPVTSILCSTQSDFERFRTLEWVSPEHIHLTGNLKFDGAPAQAVCMDEKRNYCHEFGFLNRNSNDAPPTILIGASTWPGEEGMLISVFEELSERFPDLRLLIVPRHAERKSEIAKLKTLLGVKFHFRSDAPEAANGTRIYVADTTGELSKFVAISDIAFVGKSIPPNKGGQTPIEAARNGLPVLFGSEMGNFKDFAQQLKDSNGAFVVSGQEDFQVTVSNLLEDMELRRKTGGNAQSAYTANLGAMNKTLKFLFSELKS